ncbi:MAG: PIN domain-containing protein [Caldilineaceae bacterium]
MFFVDTGYMLALEIRSDQNHSRARAHWQEVNKNRPQLVTTSYIFTEVVTFLNNRGHHAKATEVGSRLLASSAVQLVHVDQALFYEGWSYFQKYHDKEYSLTDCISFLIMQRLSIQTALTFDKHFVQAGFRMEPDT